MSCILKSILRVPLERDAFISGSRTLTYRDVRQLHENNIETILLLLGSCIVINGRKRAEFSLLLAILDGYVDRIVFLPEDIDNTLINRFYDETCANYEVYLEGDVLKFNIIQEQQESRNSLSRLTEWVIPTSGTTNVPKLVVHTYESLTRTAQRNIEVGKSFKWGLVFDIYRFSGIQVLLQSIISGSTLIITENGDSMPYILNLLSEYYCNAVSATPSFWRKVLMSQEVDKLELNRITLGGEIADKNILSALRLKFPESKISHIYASTEVGVGFSVTDGLPGFPKNFIGNGVGDITIKVDSDNILWINPGTSDQKYISKSKLFDSNGFIHTGDLVQVTEDRVYFIGRESGAINVGGNKVQPEEVEMFLLSIESVNSAFVYSKSNSMMGSLVCADIVLHDINNLDKNRVKKQILSFCRENLDAFKIPALLKIVNQLETTQSGKLRRNR